MRKIFSFVGASHTGKTTLGNFISENFEIEYRELSARPFLKDLTKSYDKQVDDIIQTRIMYNNLESVYKALFDANVNNKNILLSRSCIDVLAYARALQKGLGCQNLQENTIKELKDKIVFLYTIPDFPMSESNDTLRGMNEEIRKKTDEEICKIMANLNIDCYIIGGSLETRKIKCSNIMQRYNIKEKI